MKQKLIQLYNKNHKKLLIVPALLIILSLVYISFFYSQNHDVIHRDVSLTGGTSITVFTDKSASEVQSLLSKNFPDISVKALSDNTGKQTALVITSPEEKDVISNAIELALNIKLTNENSSVEYTGSTLAGDFYSQLLKAIIFAFLAMALVVFLVFGESTKTKVYSIILTLAAAVLTFPLSTFITISAFILAVIVFFYGIYISKTKYDYLFSALSLLVFIILFFLNYYFIIFLIAAFLFTIYTIVSVPSMAVILSAFADIIIPLAIIDFFGMRISSAGIIAFLMLIGYSVDTDILLTTRVLRRKAESVNKSMWGALKTGMTMTMTSIIAIAIALIIVYHYGSILNQIFIILILGLSFDILNTWVTNTSLIKWYVERTGR